MAAPTGMSPSTVHRIWRELGYKRHRTETFEFSSDPALEAKVRDVVGLYLDPPGGAIVLSVDEKTQIQALDRTQPHAARCARGRSSATPSTTSGHGTTCLVAALEVGTGRVATDTPDRHTGDDFLAVMRRVARAYPAGRAPRSARQRVDPQHARRAAWLARHPRACAQSPGRGPEAGRRAPDVRDQRLRARKAITSSRRNRRSPRLHTR